MQKIPGARKEWIIQLPVHGDPEDEWRGTFLHHVFLHIFPLIKSTLECIR